MLRHNRVYRVLRAGVTIVAALLRYLLLKVRRWIPGLRPTARSWDRAHGKTGRAIYRLATRQGGAIIKLGQVVGARADVMPPALIAPLRGLHDQVPARPFAALRAHVERQLGRPVDEVFASIDERALAAASLAQVHRARLITGEDVVIKIQYPEARRLFPVDLGSMRRAIRVVRWLARLDLRPLADELAAMIALELDFAREAASTTRIRANFADDAGVRVPRVHEALSTDQLLVLEFLDGTPLSKPDALRADGVDLRALADRVATLYATMIFDHGFFHGDPHPGNLLVADGGQVIALLDFGMAKELPAGFADGAAAMIVKGLAGDVDGAIAAARTIGFDPTGDPASFTEMLRMLMGDHRGGRNPLDVLRGAAMKDIPGHFTLIGRVMILLNGLSHTLVPGERVIAQAIARRLAPRIFAAQAAQAAQAAAPAPAAAAPGVDVSGGR